MGLLLVMFFMHIVDDYYLQGWLASAKQKSWWKEFVAENNMYRYDYIVALICHAFSWAFMISLPIFFIECANPTDAFYIVFMCNLAVHAFVDHCKANLKRINLVADQMIHFLQVTATWALFMNGVI